MKDISMVSDEKRQVPIKRYWSNGNTTFLATNQHTEIIYPCIKANKRKSLLLFLSLPVSYQSSQNQIIP